VRLEFAVKHSVGSGRASFAARFRPLANRGLGLGFGSCQFLGWRRGGILPIRQRFLARLQRGLFLLKTLLLVLEPFRGQTFLHLPLHFGSLFFLSRLLLARNKKSQGGDERQNGKLLHGVVRQGWFLVIRTKTAPRPYAGSLTRGRW
jgi:hypothetical protein